MTGSRWEGRGGACGPTGLNEPLLRAIYGGNWTANPSNRPGVEVHAQLARHGADAGNREK